MPKQSAVLILLYEQDGITHLPMIMRASYDGVHSDQVALPGGQVEDADQDFIHTALRETEEEIGIPPSQIEILGKISQLYIPPSNFLVQPVVGWLHGKPTYRPDPTEVARLIEAPLEDFQKEEFISEVNIKVRGGMRFDVPAFTIKGNIVWGATAMMMAEFMAIVEDL